MLARIQECILYREFSNGEILNDMAELINLYEADEEARAGGAGRNVRLFRKYLAYISYIPSGKS